MQWVYRTTVAFSLGLAGAMASLPSLSFAAAQDNAAAQKGTLHDRLPAAIRERGYIISATTGRYPPYNFLADDGKTLKGAAVDLGVAIGKVLGVEMRNEIAESVASYITGVQSGRYDFIFGPAADMPDRQQTVDMIDWSRQSVAFLVPKGNPKKISDIADTCGLKVAVQKASFALPVISKQSDLCVAAGKPAVDVQILSDQAAMALAIKSQRIDASFAGLAALAYYNSQNPGEFDIAGAGKNNLLGDVWEASIANKGSELTPVILDAWKQVFDSGAYQEIMTRWGLVGDMIKEPGINVAR